MRILLVHPQHALQRRSGGLYGRSLRYAPLTMPTLAALVPPDLGAQVTVVDEMVSDVDLGAPADLVGLTAITGTAVRAYELADHFRARGAAVVLGGVHPTLLTDEALGHADVVVRGFAERTWPRLLRAFGEGLGRGLAPREAIGALGRVLEDPEPFDPALVVPPDRSSIRARDYLGHATVEAGRGCSNHCAFCVSPVFHGGHVRRPVDEVLAEVRALRSKVVFFLDPNLLADREHARELCAALARERRWWLGCASLDVMEDPGLLDLMADSGCKGLLMGFESLDQASLASSGKVRNLGRDPAAVVAALHARGILVQACFVVGFDTEGPEAFGALADHLERVPYDLPQVSVLTPFPGTALFRDLEAQGRILTRDWSRYNGQEVVFRPLRMTPEELAVGAAQVRSRAHGWKALARRLREPPLWLRPLTVLSCLGFRAYQRRLAGLAGRGPEGVRRMT